MRAPQGPAAAAGGDTLDIIGSTIRMMVGLRNADNQFVSKHGDNMPRASDFAFDRAQGLGNLNLISQTVTDIIQGQTQALSNYAIHRKSRHAI